MNIATTKILLLSENRLDCGITVLATYLNMTFEFVIQVVHNEIATLGTTGQ